MESGLQYLRDDPGAGIEVRAVGVGDTLAVGDLRAQLEQHLGGVDGVIAVVDEPNANMGWELGYALGKGHRCALMCAGASVPSWLGLGPFEGQLVQAHASHPPNIMKVIRSEWSRWTSVQGSPERGAITLGLCPNFGAGWALSKRLSDAFPHWRWASQRSWSLRRMSELFEGVGRVVWVLPAAEHGQRRDNPQSAGHSVAYGYADSLGLPVAVFKHGEARTVMNVAEGAIPFSSNDELVSAVQKWSDSTHHRVAAGPVAPARPLEAWRARMRDNHADLLPLIEEQQKALIAEVCVKEMVSPLPRPPMAAGGDSNESREDRAGDASRRSLLSLVSEAASGGEVAPGWLLLGEPGSGKTTLLRHLAWQLASDEEGRVPVWVSLAGLPTGVGIWRYATGRMAKQLDLPGVNADTLREALEDAVASNKVWLLLDGLDEVPSAELGDMVSALRVLRANKKYRGVPMVVTSRKVILDQRCDLGEGFRQAEVQELTDGQQEDLVGRLLEGLPALAHRAKADLASQPELRDVTRTPLMLTLAVQLMRGAPEGARVELPVDRVGLLDRSIDLLLKGDYRQADAGSRGMSNARVARQVLSWMSLELHRTGVERWRDDALDEALWAARGRDKAAQWVERFANTWANDNFGGAIEPFRSELLTKSGVLGSFDGPTQPARYMHRSMRELMAADALHQLSKEDRNAVLWDGREIDESDYESMHTDSTKHANQWGEVVAVRCARFAGEEAVTELETLADQSGELAFRALKSVAHISAVAGLRVLERCRQTVPSGWSSDFVWPAWDADDVDRLLKRWTDPQGVENAVTELREAVRPELHLEALGLLWYAIEWVAGEEPDAAWFFTQCGRDPSQAPKLAFAHIPAGSFWMGSPDGVGDSRERPQLQRQVKAFQLSTTTVTRQHLERLASPTGQLPRKEANLPAVYVSWFAARLFCRWVGGRLPTETEWEYACRAGTDERWSFGDDEAMLVDHGWFSGNSDRKTQPVGKKLANPWELHDMHGNVWEWCEDRFGGYDPERLAGPTAGATRVLRGGTAWNHAEHCRSAYRDRNLPGNRNDNVGFRVALPPPACGPCSISGPDPKQVVPSRAFRHAPHLARPFW